MPFPIFWKSSFKGSRIRRKEMNGKSIFSTLISGVIVIAASLVGAQSPEYRITLTPNAQRIVSHSRPLLLNRGALAELPTLQPFAKKTAFSQKSGVPIITNPKSPALSDNKERRLIFKEDLSIGLREGDENYMFGEQVSFNVDDKGNIYVVDWDRKRIQKFGPDGKYLLTIGRKGQGPGEFQNVWTPEFDKEGNLYVVDIAQKRISFFAPGGNYLKQIVFPGVTVSGYLFFTTSQNIITTLSQMSLDDAKGAKWEHVIGLFDKQFHLRSEFLRYGGGSKPPSGRGEDAIAQFWADSMTDMAFQPSASYALAQNDEIYFGYSDAYEIKIFSPEGKLARIIRKEYDPVAVTDEDRETFAETMKTEFLRFLPAQFEAAKKKALGLIRYPKYKPAYQGFTFSEDGRLIVIANQKGDSSAILDVFDKDGRCVMHCQADIPVDGLRFKKNKVYAVATIDGYHFVKRFTVEEKVR